MPGGAPIDRLRAKVVTLYTKLTGSDKIPKGRACELMEVDDHAKLEASLEGVNETTLVLLKLVGQHVKVISGNEKCLHVAANRVFAHWKKRRGDSKRIKFTADRKRKVLARLREGYLVEDLQAAIDGMMMSEFHQKNNFQDLIHACRNAERVDAFMELNRAKPYRPKQEAAPDRYAHLPDFTGTGDEG